MWRDAGVITSSRTVATEKRPSSFDLGTAQEPLHNTMCATTTMASTDIVCGIVMCLLPSTLAVASLQVRWVWILVRGLVEGGMLLLVHQLVGRRYSRLLHLRHHCLTCSTFTRVARNRARNECDGGYGGVNQEWWQCD